MAVRLLDNWPIHTPLLDEHGRMTPPWQLWFTALVLAVNGTIAGEGSPEGVVTAEPGKGYRNLTATAGTGWYVKESVATLNTGWRAV